MNMQLYELYKFWPGIALKKRDSIYVGMMDFETQRCT